MSDVAQDAPPSLLQGGGEKEAPETGHHLEGEGGFLVAAVGRRDTAREKLRRRAREGSDTGR